MPKQPLSTLALVCGTLFSTAGIAAPSKSNETASSGAPLVVNADTRLEYLTYQRVWWTVSGELLVCRHPSAENGWRGCIKPDKTDGWAPLDTATRPGYRLTHVQFNESKNGPTLLLYWQAEAAAKEKAAAR